MRWILTNRKKILFHKWSLLRPCYYWTSQRSSINCPALFLGYNVVTSACSLSRSKYCYTLNSTKFSFSWIKFYKSLEFLTHEENCSYEINWRYNLYLKFMHKVSAVLFRVDNGLNKTNLIFERWLSSLLIKAIV